MRNIVVACTVVVLLPFGGVTAGIQASGPETQRVEPVHMTVADLGKRVDVTLIQGERIRGELHEVAADSFVVIPRGSTTPINVAYADVRRLRAGWTLKQKIEGLLMAVVTGVGFTISCMNPPC